MKRVLLTILLLALPALSSCTAAQQQAATTIAKRAIADILIPYIQDIVARGNMAVDQVEAAYAVASYALTDDAARDRQFRLLTMQCRANLDTLLSRVRHADFTRAAAEKLIADWQATYDKLLTFADSVTRTVNLAIRPRGVAENIMGAAADVSVLVVPAPADFALPPEPEPEPAQ